MKTCKISFKNCIGDLVELFFEEGKHPTQYGNGKCIEVKYKVNGEERFLPGSFIDCRYIIGYDFFTVCKEYVSGRWDNITDLSFNLPLDSFL